jgi:hypothetical protein
MCSLILLPPPSVMAQTADLAHPPKPGTDGVYKVPASNLKMLDSSGAVAYEVTETVAVFNFTNTLDHYRDPSGDLPVHLDQKTVQAFVTKRIDPQYPLEARLGHIQGAVELRVIIGKDGRVHALHIIKGTSNARRRRIQCGTSVGVQAVR